MTYNVFSGTLNLTQSISHSDLLNCMLKNCSYLVKLSFPSYAPTDDSFSKTKTLQHFYNYRFSSSIGILSVNYVMFACFPCIWRFRFSAALKCQQNRQGTWSIPYHPARQKTLPYPELQKIIWGADLLRSSYFLLKTVDHLCRKEAKDVVYTLTISTVLTSYPLLDIDWNYWNYFS